MRLRSLASLRPWLYPYNIEIIYIPIGIIYYLVSYYGTVFLCVNVLLTFTVIQPAAAKVINKQIINHHHHFLSSNLLYSKLDSSLQPLCRNPENGRMLDSPSIVLLF